MTANAWLRKLAANSVSIQIDGWPHARKNDSKRSYTIDGSSALACCWEAIALIGISAL